MSFFLITSIVYIYGEFSLLQTYTHGGTVLSREALHRLVTVAFKNSSICYLSDSPYDDEELGRCLRGVDVVFGDTRDAMGRQRFIPFTPQEYLTELKPENNEWFLNRSYYEINVSVLSKNLITNFY